MTHVLGHEWSILQNQFDSYEKYSLLIKLFSFSIFSIDLFFNNLYNLILFLLIAFIWLQDAIWKTFQHRIEVRLLRIEKLISQFSNEMDTQAYQFNTDYALQRPNFIKLLKEYIVQAIRPTVAFPHAVLLCVILWQNKAIFF